MITAMPRVAIALNDFDAGVETFRDQLGLPVVDISAGSVESLGAKLAMCVPEGGSNIELMSPANPDAPLSQSLSRFLERRGEGLFALMLEAPDPDEEAIGLAERGLNVLPLMPGASGRDVHPNSTHGVLIRVYPTNSFSGGTSPSESGLSGIMRVLIAVRDLGRARTAYQTGFGLPCDPEQHDESRGVQSFLCHPPAGGTIEFLTPADPARPFAADVASLLEHREGLYALTLHGPAVRASTALTRHGPAVRASELPTRPLGRATTAFGARIFVESPSDA